MRRCCSNTDESSSRRERTLANLRDRRHNHSLSRLIAKRDTLLDLKAQLNNEQSPDLRVAIQRAIKQLEPNT